MWLILCSRVARRCKSDGSPVAMTAASKRGAVETTKASTAWAEESFALARRWPSTPRCAAFARALTASESRISASAMPCVHWPGPTKIPGRAPRRARPGMRRVARVRARGRWHEPRTPTDRAGRPGAGRLQRTRISVEHVLGMVRLLADENLHGVPSDVGRAKLLLWTMATEFGQTHVEHVSSVESRASRAPSPSSRSLATPTGKRLRRRRV